MTKKLALACALVLTSFVSACSSTGVTCGPGTIAKNGSCVLDGDGCGSGTIAAMGSCAPSVTALVCGSGTHEESGVCVRDQAIDPPLDATPWSKPIHIGSVDSSAYGPSIAIDSSGKIFVALSLGATIEVWSSADGVAFDRRFSAPMAVLGGAQQGFATDASIALDGQGRVIVSWIEFDFNSPGFTVGVGSAVSSDGITYESRIITSGSDDLSRATLAPAPDGSVTAAWFDRTGISVAKTSTSTGRMGGPSHVFTFDLPMRPHSFPAVEGPIAFGPSGQPIVLVEVPIAAIDPPSAVARLVAVSPSISAEPLIDRKLDAAGGAIAADAAGHLRLLFSSEVSGRLAIFEARSDDATKFSDPVRVFDDAVHSSATAVSLTADEQGGFHAVFAEARSGGWLTYGAYAPPMGDFGAPSRIGDVPALETLHDTNAGLETAIAVRAGRRCAAWVDPRNGVYFATAPTP